MNFLSETIICLGIMGCTSLEDIPAKEVPSVVRNSFRTEFPDAIEIEWENEKENYEVEFEINNVDYAVCFDKAGSLLMQKQDIAADYLPIAVIKTLRQDFPNYEIDDVEMVKKEDATYYQLELEGKLLDKNEIFSSDGQATTEINYWE